VNVRLLMFAAVLVVTTAAWAHDPPVPVPIPAAGAFGPPAPGSYHLPVIQPGPKGDVLDEAGRAHEIAQLTQGHITLLGLVYTRCHDAQGCPRATWAFSQVRSLLRADPALERHVRMVTLSFDPAHDTPRAIAEYASNVRAPGPGAQWRFLTTASSAQLAPILDALGQDVARTRDSPEEFEHTVKVFLLDPRGDVREIYSSAWLVPEIIVNDMRTLERESLQSAASASGGQLQKRFRSP
jgi:cytochrome oxidase Cu insertion factor (SCO1/SenC/PrrC family)